MRKILVVGAGQSGLQLALGLLSHGYEVTLMSNRTADEIRSGRVMSTQCMFDTALQHERDLQLNFWESQAPKIEGLGVSVAAPGSWAEGPAARAIDWVGKLDGYAQSVDQRVKMAGWMETFAQRGGQLVIHGAAVGDLDYFARTYDLVLVSAGKGELVSMFGRDASRSPYTEPQRALAVSYVHGLGPRPEHPDYYAVRCNLVPGVGELFVMPTLTTSGPADILFWEGIPGGPLDVFNGVKDPSEHLSLTLELMERYTP
ncbi:styrene monooxygenase/indole monooxygenase family protein, partial [Streptomyces sp. NPDC059627]